MKITYLFGAGASADKLPIVSNMPRRLINFRNYIKSKYKASTNKSGIEAEKELHERADASVALTKDLDELLEAIVEERNGEFFHKTASIDTYAKQLLIRGDSDSKAKLKKLKRALILFFCI